MKIKEVIRSKEFKILIYFILILIIVIVIGRIYNDYLTGINRYNWLGADVDGDGDIGDVEGYAYLFTGFAKDIGGEIASVVKTGIELLPLDIKELTVPICLIFQAIAVIVKKAKKILTNIAISINLLCSILAMATSMLGNSWIIKGIVVFDMLISIVLLIWNNRNKNQTKLDLYNMNEENSFIDTKKE